MLSIMKRSRVFGKVLVVDDTPMNIEMLNGLLTPEGYVVEGAEGGAETLEKNQ